MQLTTLTIRVGQDEAAFLDQVASRHEGILSKQGVLRLLLQQAQQSGWDPLANPQVMPYDLGKGGRGVGASGFELTTAEETAYEKPSSSSSNEEEKENFSKRRVPKQVVSGDQRKRFVFSVPDDLQLFKPDLLAYWREDKSGKKSEAAAKTLINGCRAILDRYGEKVLRDQIGLARGYGWVNITLANYERFGLNKAQQGAPSQPEPRHPASRVFTADKGFDDGPTTNPILKDMF